MKKSILLLAMACVGSGSPAALAQDSMPMRVCLKVKALGSLQGLGNFRFDGRISGTDRSPHHGYWVAAIDAQDNLWAQNGGGAARDGGKVAFGVWNISTYPLNFVVLRVATADDFQALRNLARLKRSLSAEDRSLYPVASPLNDCIFDLDGDDLGSAVPVNPDGKCGCP